MSKQYRLEIPENLIDTDDVLGKCFQVLNGKEVKIKGKFKDYCEITPAIGEYPVFKVIIRWLKEIKQPITFDEWIIPKRNWLLDNIGDGRDDIVIKFLRECHEWTIENERLKHSPKKTFLQCISEKPRYYSYPDEEFSIARARREGWEACEKNRGYND